MIIIECILQNMQENIIDSLPENVPTELMLGKTRYAQIKIQTDTQPSLLNVQLHSLQPHRGDPVFKCCQ